MKGVVAASLWGMVIFAVASFLLMFRYVASTPIWESPTDFYQYYGSITFFSVAIFPPFVPALVPAVFYTRSLREGAKAGFVVYFLIVLVAYVWVDIIFGPVAYDAGGSFGFSLFLYFIVVVLGTLGGAVGGAIGGWRARHRVAKPVWDASRR